jgi:hypothetical protein
MDVSNAPLRGRRRAPGGSSFRPRELGTSRRVEAEEI